MAAILLSKAENRAKARRDDSGRAQIYGPSGEYVSVPEDVVGQLVEICRCRHGRHKPIRLTQARITHRRDAWACGNAGLWTRIAGDALPTLPQALPLKDANDIFLNKMNFYFY